MKFLSIYTVDAADMSGPPDEHEMMAMGRLINEMQTAGVLLDFGGTASGGMELRLEKRGAEITVTDGPFSETKEVIGGFAVLSCASRDEALKWSKIFLETAGDGVSELHQLAEF